MSQEVKNLPLHIKTLLYKHAVAKSRNPDEVYMHYLCERFLYRLSKTKYSKEFILKGAWSIRIHNMPETRPTRDIDFLGFLKNDLDNLKEVFSEICLVECDFDGVKFPTEYVKVEPIMDGIGTRVKILSELGKTKYYIPIDIGFGDSVYPNPRDEKITTMLNFEPFTLLTYPFESIIADKFDAMIKHGETVSRIKDFFDIYHLSKNYSFFGDTLLQSILTTLTHTRRSIPDDLVFLSNSFAIGNKKTWTAFINNLNLGQKSMEFEKIVKLISDFLMPIIDAIRTKSEFKKKWNTSGYWE